MGKKVRWINRFHLGAHGGRRLEDTAAGHGDLLGADATEPLPVNLLDIVRASVKVSLRHNLTVTTKEHGKIAPLFLTLQLKWCKEW